MDYVRAAHLHVAMSRGDLLRLEWLAMIETQDRRTIEHVLRATLLSSELARRMCKTDVDWYILVTCPRLTLVHSGCRMADRSAFEFRGYLQYLSSGGVFQVCPLYYIVFKRSCVSRGRSNRAGSTKRSSMRGACSGFFYRQIWIIS